METTIVNIPPPADNPPPPIPVLTPVQYPPPPQQQPPQQQNANKGGAGTSCFKGCLYMSFALVVAVIIGVAFMIGSCALVMSNIGDMAEVFTEGFSEGFNNSAIGRVHGKKGGPKVLDLHLKGVINFAADSSFFADENSSVAVLRAIRGSIHDKEVRGILLRVDSGGGEITASDIIWKALCDFKAEDPKRYVVVHMGAIAASGAYYISCAADKIVAHPTTMTGSIGVKISSFNMKELADKIGVKNTTIASGENKEFLHPLKDMTPEQEEMLQGIVDNLHSRFVAIVAQGRKMDEADVRALADGRVMLAAEAQDAGLLDHIGYEKDAKNLFHLYFLEEPEFITREPGRWNFLRNPAFYGEAAAAAIETATRNEEHIVVK